MTANLPPVLLLHGWGGSFASIYEAYGWSGAFEALGRCVIAFDLPGHGSSKAATEPGAYSDLAGAVAASLPSYPVDVVGFSLGAKLALALASANRTLYRRIVIGGVGDNIFAPEASGELLAQALVGPGLTAVPDSVRALASYAVRNGNDAAAMAAVLRRPSNPVMSPGDLPSGEGILLINSDADAIALPDQALRAAMPKAACIRFKGGGHLSLPADPVFRGEAIRFLSAK